MNKLLLTLGSLCMTTAAAGVGGFFVSSTMRKNAEINEKLLNKIKSLRDEKKDLDATIKDLKKKASEQIDDLNKRMSETSKSALESINKLKKELEESKNNNNKATEVLLETAAVIVNNTTNMLTEIISTYMVSYAGIMQRDEKNGAVVEDKDVTLYVLNDFKDKKVDDLVLSNLIKTEKTEGYTEFIIKNNKEIKKDDINVISKALLSEIFGFLYEEITTVDKVIGMKIEEASALSVKLLNECNTSINTNITTLLGKLNTKITELSGEVSRLTEELDTKNKELETLKKEIEAAKKALEDFSEEMDKKFNEIDDNAEYNEFIMTQTEDFIIENQTEIGNFARAINPFKVGMKIEEAQKQALPEILKELKIPTFGYKFINLVLTPIDKAEYFDTEKNEFKELDKEFVIKGTLQFGKWEKDKFTPKEGFKGFENAKFVDRDIKVQKVIK